MVAVLVRYDEEPYYFPDAPTLLRALHRNAKAEGVTTAQPGTQGWSDRDLKQVEQLLRPHTYPPCATVSACLRKWPLFAHRGKGYREGPSMPGGKELVTFRDEDWDYPKPIVPPVIAGCRKERPTGETKALEGPRPDSGSEGTLRERWQATHGRDPPAWADKGFAGIKEHMRQQAAAAKETSEEEVTVYCPPRNLTPRQQMRALLDPQLPGTRVPAERPVSYEDDQAIPDHALPRFQGNPNDNYQVMSPVPENLRGYWTKAHQSARWEGDGKGDIRIQEGRLQKVIKGYAALATRCMTTYEYKAPGGLNHGLSALHDEIDKYMVPPMVEHASALLVDFVTLYQEREFHRKRLVQLEQQALEAQSASDVETNILRARILGLNQGIERAHQTTEWLEEQMQAVGA